MDYGLRFEKLINKIMGRPDVITYAEYWKDKEERAALLFTACIIKYDKKSTSDVKAKLEYFMTKIFKEDNKDKKTSIACLNFLERLE
jgi:hypothetical protein